jgi:hypothetical protein
MEPTNKSFVSKDISRAVVDGMERASDEIIEDIKQRISTAYPPASKPGEPPHRRTGNLLASNDSFVTSDVGGLEVTMTLSNSAFYAGFLRDGTSKMAARDFFQDSDADRYLPKVIDAVVDEITSQFNQ